MGVNKETGLSFPNFCNLAHSFDIPYLYVKDHAAFPDIHAYLPSPGPMIFEINMHPDQPQAPRSVNRRNPDGTMNPTKLEDAYPFLSREELAEAMDESFDRNG
jgi:acetolactate synthase-1/2/3 large subunit